MDTKLKSILNRTLHLFFAYGIKPITMDHIAREQGLSKKTLYQYFDSKEALVTQTFMHHLDAQEQAISNIRNENLNALDELYRIYNLKVQHLFSINPALPLDLKRHFPHTWDLCLSHRDGFLFQQVVENFQAGIKNGWYRDDLEVEILATLFLNQFNILFYNYSSSQAGYALDVVTEALFNYHIRGIGSEKGVVYAENNQGG